MRDLLDISKPFADLDAPVDLETERAITRWLHAEVRLLDAERYQEWLTRCIDPDIHYWMPDMETRRRDDPRGMFAYGEAAYFDDSWKELEIRVKRYNEPSAWADNPQTRHLHQISNIEVNATDDPTLFCGAFGLHQCAQPQRGGSGYRPWPPRGCAAGRAGRLSAAASPGVHRAERPAVEKPQYVLLMAGF